jgi:hypothetical protein
MKESLIAQLVTRVLRRVPVTLTFAADLYESHRSAAPLTPHYSGAILP